MKRETVYKLSCAVAAVCALLLHVAGWLAAMLLCRRTEFTDIFNAGIMPLFLAVCLYLMQKWGRVTESLLRHPRILCALLAILGFFAIAHDYGSGLLIPLFYVLAAAVCLHGTREHSPGLMLAVLNTAAFLAVALVNCGSAMILLFAAAVWVGLKARKRMTLSDRVAFVVLLLLQIFLSVTLNDRLFSCSVYDELWHCGRYDCWDAVTPMIREIWAGKTVLNSEDLIWLDGSRLAVIAALWGKACAIVCIVLTGVFCAALTVAFCTARNRLKSDVLGPVCLLFIPMFLIYILRCCGVPVPELLKDDAVPFFGNDPFVTATALLTVIWMSFPVTPPCRSTELFETLLPAGETDELRRRTTSFFGDMGGTDMKTFRTLRDSFDIGETAVSLLRREDNDFWTNAIGYETVTLLRYDGSAEGVRDFFAAISQGGAVAVRLLAPPDADMIDLFPLLKDLLPQDEQPVACSVEYDGTLKEDQICLLVAVLSDSCMENDE